MAYDKTVPQATSQISVTQKPILNNFEFLQTGLSQEHRFTFSGAGNDMNHLKASMPNLGVAPVLPPNTNGMYYVEGGAAMFWDGTNKSRLNGILAAVNFDSTGTAPNYITIRSSFNVSEVIRDAGGQYTVKFAIDLPNNNYIVQCTGMFDDSFLCTACIKGNSSYGSSVTTKLIKVSFGRSAGTFDVKMGNVIVYGV